MYVQPSAMRRRRAGDSERWDSDHCVISISHVIWSEQSISQTSPQCFISFDK